jgi:hypothetical protein
LSSGIAIDAEVIGVDDLNVGPRHGPFDWKLDVSEVAAVATYVRNAWGNAAPEVKVRTVAKLRRRYGVRVER